MKTLSKAGIGAVGAIAIVLTQVSPAMADLAPQANDVVGVGSDTAQFGLEFLADGDQNGNVGYNGSNTSRRLISFDSTGDASATTTAGATILLRANSKPVTRPNGSGAGISALNADTGSTETVNWVRSSRLPTAAEQTAATNNGWGGLHVYQFATDGLKVAVSNTVATHAPAALTPTDLVNIYNGTYTKWSDVPNYTGGFGGNAIKAYIPQAGSGTRNFFLADLQPEHDRGPGRRIARHRGLRRRDDGRPAARVRRRLALQERVDVDHLVGRPVGPPADSLGADQRQPRAAGRQRVGQRIAGPAHVLHRVAEDALPGRDGDDVALLQVLAVGAFGSAWALAWWGTAQAWLTFVPVLLVGLWGACDSFLQVLPNVM